MSVTIAGIESIIVPGLRLKLTAVGLAITTVGTNADLANPIRKALIMVGLAPVDPVVVVDSDVAALSGLLFERFLDYVRIGVLRAILGNCWQVDQQAGTNYQKLSQLAIQVQAEIADLEATVKKPYGAALAPTSVGVMVDGLRIPRAWPSRGYPFGGHPYGGDFH